MVCGKKMNVKPCWSKTWYSIPCRWAIRQSYQMPQQRTHSPGFPRWRGQSWAMCGSQCDLAFATWPIPSDYSTVYNSHGTENTCSKGQILTKLLRINGIRHIKWDLQHESKSENRIITVENKQKPYIPLRASISFNVTFFLLCWHLCALR